MDVFEILTRWPFLLPLLTLMVVFVPVLSKAIYEIIQLSRRFAELEKHSHELEKERDNLEKRHQAVCEALQSNIKSAGLAVNMEQWHDLIVRDEAVRDFIREQKEKPDATG